MEAGWETSVDWWRRHCEHCHPVLPGCCFEMMDAPDRSGIVKLLVRLMVVKSSDGNGDQRYRCFIDMESSCLVLSCLVFQSIWMKEKKDPVDGNTFEILQRWFRHPRKFGSTRPLYASSTAQAKHSHL